MKKILLLLIFCVSISCAKEKDEVTVALYARVLIGEWQLSEAYISPGGETEWQTVKNGDIFEFNNDSSFSQTNTTENFYNRSGSFSYENETLTLIYPKDSVETSQSYKVVIENKSMTITPSAPTFCIEACLYRYKKID